MSRFSEVWQEAFPGWCCQHVVRVKSGATEQPLVVLLLSFSALNLRWAAERSVSWIQWSNSGRQHPWTRSFRENWLLFPASFKSRRKEKNGMKIGAMGKTQQTIRSSPVWGGSSHGQRGDGTDGLRVRVSPQPPPLRLQVGQIHSVGRVPHALPVLTCSVADEKRERVTLRVVYISVFFDLLSILVGFSGGRRLHCIIKEKPVEFDPPVWSSLMWKEASTAF